jgi:hypothetical protein
MRATYSVASHAIFHWPTGLFSPQKLGEISAFESWEGSGGLCQAAGNCKSVDFDVLIGLWPNRILREQLRNL